MCGISLPRYPRPSGRESTLRLCGGSLVPDYCFSAAAWIPALRAKMTRAKGGGEVVHLRHLSHTYQPLSAAPPVSPSLS